MTLRFRARALICLNYSLLEPLVKTIFCILQSLVLNLNVTSCHYNPEIFIKTGLCLNLDLKR